ncbi:hypothetical protein [Nostoc sphaeroides]|uniref:Type II restriction enzyme n=1 Tax=Nostoc sphaeroides CCNUC1 TaxID=2653204 RepID=A0A5P8W4W7_9NOSO|nr:type II restriction enzyme [Nostoc sphaeroides CCNUC1]
MQVGIEVSFQVTTNSVIERKAGQAKSRFEQIETFLLKSLRCFVVF